MFNENEYLLFERGHPLGHGSQRVYLFPCGLGMSVEHSKFAHADESFYVLTVIKDVNRVSLNWRHADESDKLDVPLRVSVRYDRVQKTVRDFAEWALKRTPADVAMPSPNLIDKNVPEDVRAIVQDQAKASKVKP